MARGPMAGSDSSLLLSLITLNCKGLKANGDYVRNLVASNDIVCLSETWLRPNELSVLSTMTSTLDKNYGVFQKSSMQDTDSDYSGRPFGGLAVITKTNPLVSYSEIVTTSDRLLAIGAYDKSGELVHTIINVYLPFFQSGNADQLLLFVETLDELQVLIDEYGSRAPFKICGDMNAQLPMESAVAKDWYRQGGFNANSVLLYDFLAGNELCVADFNFNQQVHHTYFVHKSRTYTWIDHVFANSYDISSVISCKILPECSDNLGDHLPIQTRFNVKLKNATVSKCVSLNAPVGSQPKLDWSRADRKEEYKRVLSESLKLVPMLSVSAKDSFESKQKKIDDYLKVLCDTLHSAADKAGCVAVAKRKKLYWCPQLQDLKTRKKFWWDLWVDNDRPRSGVIHDCYKHVKRQFRRVSRQCTQKYLDDKARLLSSKFSLGRSRLFWNSIKRQRQFKSSSLLDASDFASFYSGIMQDDCEGDLTPFQNEVKDHVTQAFETHCGKDFVVSISPTSVFESLSKLNKGCAAGADGIATEHLYYGRSGILCEHLSSFYSTIFSTGVVPYCFTIGTIIPLLKKSTLNPNLPANYRPITLTSTFAKLAEVFLKPDDDDLNLSNSQYGFRECRGTEFCTAMLNDVSLYCKSKHTPLHICSLDAEKCFDKIWHPGLFYKLLGKLPIEHWMFLHRWYSQMKAAVRWKGAVTDLFQVTRGTRQGSALSPVLFNIFINDLLLDIERSGKGGVKIGRYLFNFFAYADDITLFSTTVTGLQDLIDICDGYAKTWRFNFGINKTKCMTVGANRSTLEPKWSLSGKEIENVNSLDILGVIFDKYVTGYKHVEKRMCATRRSFYSLVQCGLGCPGGLSSEAKIELLRCVCMPTLFYGCGSVFLSKGCMKKLGSLQGSLIKISFGLSKTLHHSPIIRAFDFKNVAETVKEQLTNLTYRVARVNCPARDLILLRELKDIPGSLSQRLSVFGVHTQSAVLSQKLKKCFLDKNGVEDSVKQLILHPNFKHRNSKERVLLRGLLCSF